MKISIIVLGFIFLYLNLILTYNGIVKHNDKAFAKLSLEIATLNREKEVHWMLPKNSTCRTKAKYYRDSKDRLYPADRKVCERDELVCDWSMP